MIDEQQPLIPEKTPQSKRPIQSIWRRGEMDPEHCLTVHVHGDTDISVMIGSVDHMGSPYTIEGMEDSNRRFASVTFCDCSAGGGRSLNTRRALIELMKAIKKDLDADTKNGNGERGGVIYE